MNCKTIDGTITDRQRVKENRDRKTWLALVVTICLLALAGCSSTSRNSFPAIDPVVQVTAQSGSPQSHAINGAFGTLLVAMVTSNGLPASGVVVNFTAPATGASGTFGPKGGNTATATTDSNGLATSTLFTANGKVGIYTVTASAPGAAAVALFDLTNTAGAPASVTVTAGNTQSTTVNSSFINPLQVSVVDSGNNPVSNATVVFTAPATGASGIFASSSTNLATALTNGSGIAVSPIFTANGVAGADPVVAAVSGTTATASFNLTNMPGPPETASIVSGTSQTAIGGKAFPAPLSVLVVDNLQNPVPGVTVTFTAPSSAASVAFVNGTNTTTATTDATGIATSSSMTANSLAGTFLVTAAATGATPASFTLTNYPVGSQYYSFYLRGQEDLLSGAFSGFYGLAGSVLISPTGDVLAGEQDYSDGFFAVSPQPSGDTITGGSLTLGSSTHQGTLVLNTNDLNIGVSGVETFGVQFVNSNHALIAQYDGSATSSGSLDLQTLPALSTSNLKGGYAFTLTGIDPDFLPVGYGGVFSIGANGTTLEDGLLDTNDAGIGVPVPASALTGTLSIPDAFGRGTITSTLNYDVLTGGPSPVSLNYYIVGPEVIRIIDVDSIGDSAIGSAYGQGTNASAASDASLGSSIFGVEGNIDSSQYGVAGMFSTNSSSGTFSGVADDNELIFGLAFPDATMAGTYSIASTGYGSFTITPGDVGDISAFGLYMADPNLNLLDPNNTSAGTGGGLLMDTDAFFAGGTGILIPQTDTSTSSFTGQYAIGGQDQNYLTGGLGELDFVGGATVTSGTLSGSALVSDPFLTLGAKATDSGVRFLGTPLPDPSNAGRFSMLSTNSTPNPLEIRVGGLVQDFDVVMYQANGGQFFWLDEDAASVFLGSLQQFGSFTTIPSVEADSRNKR